MKQYYQVEVRETYSKFVDVYVDSEDLIDEEIKNMEETGEIEWDRGEDFDGWEIISVDEVHYADWQIKRVQRWCMDMVSVTAIVDPDWVESEMDEYDCQDWLEQIRDRGVNVPEEATSSDLWDAVEAYRRKDMSYGK